MGKPDYRPGRRRRPIILFALDWAAGVLVGILLVMLGAGVVALFVPAGPERLGALLRMSAIVWPIGAALGVWLSFGRPFTALGLGVSLGLTCVGVGALALPFWWGLELGRGLGGLAALVILIMAPTFARVGVALVRRRGQDD